MNTQTDEAESAQIAAIAALIADKKRMDWLEANNIHIKKPATMQPYGIEISASGTNIRNSIDAAMQTPTEETK